MAKQNFRCAGCGTRVEPGKQIRNISFEPDTWYIKEGSDEENLTSFQLAIYYKEKLFKINETL